MLCVAKSYNACTTSHTCAAAITAWVGDHHPVEGIADIIGDTVSLPGTGHAHHQIAALEEVDAVVEAIADQPDFVGRNAINVPAVEQFGEAAVTRRIHGEVAVGIDQRSTIAHGGTGEAVTRAVDGDGILHPGGFGDLLSDLGPLFPGRAFARYVDASLVKEGLVDKRSGHGQRIGEATVAHSLQNRGREVGFIVG